MANEITDKEMMMLQVKDVMNKEVITVRRSITLAELLKLFCDFHTFPLVPVVEEDGRLVGTVSFRSLIDIFQPHLSTVLRAISFLEREEADIFRLEITPEMGNLFVVDDLMETGIFSINEEKSLQEAYRLMKRHSTERLPVVNAEGKLVGMIGMFDIVMMLFRQKGIIK